jgi:hypothetical protein
MTTQTVQTQAVRIISDTLNGKTNNTSMIRKVKQETTQTIKNLK